MQPQNINFDDQLLRAMGLRPERLSQEQKDKALDDILYTLNSRVAERVAGQLGEAKIKELDALLAQRAEEREVASWLGNNVPNYSQILEEEARAMKAEHDETMKRMREG